MSTILRPLYPVRPLLRKNADQLGLFGGIEPVKATAKAKARQKLYGGTAAPVVPKPKTAPKPIAVPGKKPKEGDTRTNRAGNKEVLRSGRWRLADNPQVVAKEPPAAIVPVVEDIQEQDLVDESLPDVPMADSEEVQGDEADQAIDKITNAARSISEAQQNLKNRAMIYQVEAKERLAMQRGLPLNAYYELNYQEWMDVQDQPEALPQAEPEPMLEEVLEDEGMEDDAEVMPEVEAEEGLPSANKMPATYEETQNSNLTWEDIPALYENGHIDQIAWILDQPFLSLPFSAASRMLSILGFKDAKKKQILNKRYREEFFKKYPDSPGPSDWHGGFDIYMLRDAIESEGSLSKQKSQRAAKTQKVLKDAKEAFKANRHTGVQAYLLDLERKRKSLMDKASDMYDDAERMNRIWADARESGEIQGGQRHWVDALSARGQGPVGTRQRAHTRRLEAQKIKQEIEEIAQNPSFYENRYMHLASDVNTVDPLVQSTTLTKALYPGPYLTLLGVRYVLDSDRGVLRKASMSWEDFRSEAEAMHKEANSDDDPCWKGYEAVGMKRKKGRMVPNCVPVSR